QIESWAVQVTGVTRGDAAWHLLYETNTNNDLAPDGQEYVVVHTRAKSLLGSDANRGLYPQLTGDKLIAYTPTAAVVPNDRPDEYLAGNEFDIDFPYLVALGEGDLILQVDDLGSALGVSPAFVVVDADASLEIDPALRSIKPTDVGVDPREPAAVAEKVTTEDFAVTVHEIVRGEAAFQRLLKANTFNDPPKEGMEYVSALVEVRSLATKDETVMVTDTDFYSVIGDAEDVEATAIKYTSVVEPEPQMHFYLYPGGTGVGWVTVAVPKNTQNVRLVFGPSFGSSDLNTRYFAIE
ncbi:MAG: DUF4352 domain-containing protein, partial [Oscillochloris sp.]|nr:DUF4352 domain-containing protein [Oscillochloris sp.]